MRQDGSKCPVMMGRAALGGCSADRESIGRQREGAGVGRDEEGEGRFKEERRRQRKGRET